MDMESLHAAGENTVLVAYDAALDAAVVDELHRRAPWADFAPAADFGPEASGAHLAIAAGPGLFLLDALEAGVPVVAPACSETRRYMREGGGVLTATDADALAEGMLRIIAMAPAARRVMGRIGRNHLLALVG